MSVIEVSHLTKDYGNHKGAFDVSFSIEKGEVFGFLGPNGAGKTTTIRHLLGFLNSTSGSCSIDGLNTRTDQAKIQEKLGYLPGEITFLEDMTGIQFLHFMAKMRNMKDVSRMEELIQFFELDPKGRIKKMSKGMKQKIGIVCAFMHNPEILILDEPTSGLDPLMQNRFIQLIIEEKKKGKTILMSSHSFEEVERTCDRVGIIKEGNLVALETVSVLKESQRKVYGVTFRTEEDKKKFEKEKIEIIYSHDLTCHVAIKGNINPLLKILTKYDLQGFDAINQSLEDIFMGFYGGNNHVE